MYASHEDFCLSGGDRKLTVAQIDVRDLADLLIASLTTKAAANKRFVVGHPFKFQDIADSLKKMPQLAGRMAKDNDEVVVPIRLDTKPVEEALPIKYRTLDQTFQDTAAHIMKLEAERKV
jgi:nucleoside-diphosphate-sugar epimerase